VETLKNRISAANNNMPLTKMKINVMNGSFLNKVCCTDVPHQP
jgi:hypothetical protein